jgi:hypothetical protein
MSVSAFYTTPVACELHPTMSGGQSQNNYWSTPAANYNPYTTTPSNYPPYQYAPQQTYAYPPQPGGQGYSYSTYDTGQNGALPVPPVHAPYPYSTYSPAPGTITAKRLFFSIIFSDSIAVLPSAPLPYYTSPSYPSLPSAPTTPLTPSAPAATATVHRVRLIQ